MRRAATAMRCPHTTRKSSLRSLWLEEAHVQNGEDPAQPKMNKSMFFINLFFKNLLSFPGQGHHQLQPH